MSNHREVAVEAAGSVKEEHAVVWNNSLIDMDIDPFTECACGNQLPCPIRVAYEAGLADATPPEQEADRG